MSRMDLKSAKKPKIGGLDDVMVPKDNLILRLPDAVISVTELFDEGLEAD